MRFMHERGASVRSLLPSLSVDTPCASPRNITIRLAALAILALLLAAIYAFWIRQRQLHWGATAEEIARPMPADDMVQHPAFDATRAITIRARPEQIWPWLVQMGYGRAGFYGYDLIENPGGGSAMRSAHTILPQFQNPRPGDILPLSVAASLVYGPIEPNHHVVWLGRDDPPAGVFIWQLVPVDESHTRLISRIRWRYLRTPFGFVLGVFTEFADHVAVRAILGGVRDRAEGRTPRSLFSQACEIASWLLAVFELALASGWIFRWHGWKQAWLLAAGAGFLLQLLLYSGLPVWLSAPLPLLYLAVMLRVRHMHHAAWPVETRSHAPVVAS
jgi:hypothetical protein